MNAVANGFNDERADSKGTDGMLYNPMCRRMYPSTRQVYFAICQAACKTIFHPSETSQLGTSIPVKNFGLLVSDP